MKALRYIALALLLAVLILSTIVVLGEPVEGSIFDTALNCIFAKAIAAIAFYYSATTIYKLIK